QTCALPIYPSYRHHQGFKRSRCADPVSDVGGDAVIFFGGGVGRAHLLRQLLGATTEVVVGVGDGDLFLAIGVDVTVSALVDGGAAAQQDRTVGDLVTENLEQVDVTVQDRLGMVEVDDIGFS